MAANPVHLMTVEEFSQLPEPDSGFTYELHYGELVRVTRPKLKHHILQSRLCDLLSPLAPTGSYVAYEVPFRALSEHDIRAADVAYVSPERWAQIDPEDAVHGAPDLVIEVLSPSNTGSEMLDRERLCLKHGSQEFWLVDPKHQIVRVSTSAGLTTFYSKGQSIPLPLFGDQTLSVDAIFA